MVLRTYRILCMLAVVFIPAFGVLHRAVELSAWDPLWARLLVAALPLAAVVLSYRSAAVRQRFVPITRVLLYLLTAWMIGLCALNDFQPIYAIGFLFGVTVMGASFGVGVERLRPLLSYFLFSVGCTAVGVFGALGLEERAALLLLAVAGVKTVLFVTIAPHVHARQRMAETQRELAKSKAQLSAAQRIAHLGHWVWDLRADETTWSDETYRLLGLRPGAVPAVLESILTAVHPADRARVRQRVLDVMRRDELGSAMKNMEFRVVHSGSEERVLRANCEIVPGGDGQPAQVLGTVLDVTPQKRYERELEQAREHAEELLRLRTSMLNNVSHELRTPLTSIIGFSEVLVEETPEPQQEIAEIVLQSARRLKSTVNSVMDLAQIEGGGLAPELETLDVRGEVREVVTLLRTQAADKGLSLETRLPDAPACARLDAHCLGRILTNLVGNAIKFTEEGGVTVSVEAEGEQVHLRVRDTGIGIGEAFLPDLFSEFRQESDGLQRSHEGSGLGLAITRQLVDIMGGEIHVKSRKGEGSTFTVCLPRVAAGAGGGAASRRERAVA